MYLGRAVEKPYTNTDHENELVAKFVALYSQAKSVHDACDDVNPKNLEKWRKAYYGTLAALNKEGEESKRKGKSLRKMIFEILKSQNPKFAEVKAITTGRTYNNNARQTATGGSDFWESGVVNPDRILYDLAIILHPELKLSADGEKALYYYKPLR